MTLHAHWFCIIAGWVLAGRTAAQTIPPACRPLIDAERKQIMTPNHSYWTERTGHPGDPATTLEAISVGGTIYLQIHGRWTRSPSGPKEALQRLDDNLRSATELTCQRVGEESVNGTPAVVYTSHAVNEGVKGDARTWIGISSGLILRQESDMADEDGSIRQHLSMRWEYDGVRAPAGVER
jgi:hypothetical protein